MQVDLKNLASELGRPGLPTQLAIAAAIGADQGFVSLAKAGKLTRVTPRVIALAQYVRSRIGDMCEEARSEPATTPLTSSAIDCLRRYLADGYDEKIVIDQLAVLRRAQSAKRLLDKAEG